MAVAWARRSVRDGGLAHLCALVELAEQIRAVATQRLGRVHGRIGPVDEHVELELRAAAARNPNADGGLDRLVAGDAQRLLHDHGAQIFGEPHRVFGRRLRQDEHELFAAVATEHVARPDRVGDEAGDLAQDCVAGVVAVGVVDLLETVDVDECDAQWLVMTGRPLDLGGKRRQQRLPVRNAGQSVVRGSGLGLGEGAGGGIERTSQPAFARNADLAQLDRLVGLEGTFEGRGDAIQAPAEVAPRHERHGRHAGHGGHGEHGKECRALVWSGLRSDGHGDHDERRNGDRSQEPEGTNNEQHRREDEPGGPARPWADGPAVRCGTLAIASFPAMVWIGAVPDRYSRRTMSASADGVSPQVFHSR